MPELNDRIAGGLIGLFVGDALGVPYEFHDPTDIPALHLIEFEPPRDFRRAHQGTPPGTLSDDGAQALCLLSSLVLRGRFKPHDFGHRLVNWYNDGFQAVDGRVFDVGVQTAKSIAAIQRGVPALAAGSDDQYSQGNGSLMRVLPLALWHRGSDEALVVDAHAQSKVTHSHLVCQVCCALYCLWARQLLAMPDPNPNYGWLGAWDLALERLRTVYAQQPAHLQVLNDVLRPEAERDVHGSGFVLDCLYSARWALNKGNYEAVVRAAISLGHDTDTTACVAGGLAGIRDGANAIPPRWRTALRGGELIEPLLAELQAYLRS
jgi:ADP-ribosyl-[dinitrogen reductase] hydrolase